MRAAHFKIAQAHAENGRIAEAIAAYREAIRLSGPSAPWGHVAIARLLEQAGLDDAARGEYAEALREDPAYQEACDGLIQMGKRRGGQALAPPSCARRGS
jgi:tetratricopeptide (TPR) repeat protein